jgi:inosine/guanosine/xanthosine phosphorylase family protein
MKLLGVKTLLITNAAGSLQESMQPGSLMLVRDHLNFQCNNPLIGTHDPDFGPRFIGLENLYNQTLRTQLKDTANNLNLSLREGVYVGVLGPMFETPAEINMFQMLGGDAVGMSTIPEAIAAHHCGIEVAVISVITNLGAGMTSEVLSHEGTLEGAKLGIEKLKRLAQQFLKQMN